MLASVVVTLIGEDAPGIVDAVSRCVGPDTQGHT